MTNADTPAVSVVVATRNRAGLLGEALASIAAQTFTDFEVHVIDDGSDAATLAAYDALWAGLDGRFHLHRAVAPGVPGTGPSAARNRGIRQARGEFVAFLDDDDRWIKDDHLAAGVEALRRHQGDYYFANMAGLRQGTTVIPDWFPNSPGLTAGPRLGEAPPVHEVGRQPLLAMMRHHLIHPDATVVRRQLLLEVGGFYERIRFSEDYELMMRLMDRCRRVLYRPEVVVHYRLPEADSVSSLDSRTEHALQILCGIQHVRVSCLDPAVRRCARARESWTLRQLAGYLQDAGRGGAALPLAWQALCVFPTPGTAAFLAKSLVRALAGSVRRRPVVEEKPTRTPRRTEAGAAQSVS
jgi:glycosyltransferase involved in cell wall biosynthesis